MKNKDITFDMVTTKGGDMGETSLYNGERRRKDDFKMLSSVLCNSNSCMCK